MKTFKFLFILVVVASLLSGCNKVYQKTANGFTTTIDSTVIEIQFYSPEIVRVLKSPTGFVFEKKSLSVIKEPEAIPIQITKNEKLLIASSDKLKVELNLANGVIQFFDVTNNELIAEKEGETSFKPKQDLGTGTFAVKQTFWLEPDEFIYGLGQIQHGKMSQRKQNVMLLQGNLETVIPFIQSEKGYGLFWDNYSRTTFNDDSTGTTFDSEIGDCIDYYVLLGGNADGVIAQMRDLTGQAPMFPYWTFGYWQSKERYKSQDETVGVVKKYRELGVPLDGIIQDWQYWGDNYHWNAMEFLNPNFPEPKKMIDEVHDMNAHIIISVWASFGPQTEQYKTMDTMGMLMDFKTWPLIAEDKWPITPNDTPSGVKPYDPYNPEARDIYWDFMNRGLFSLGIDGWWLDSTEPDHLEITDNDFDNKTYLGSLRKVRNAFPLMTVGGVYTHQREETSDKRVFILTRSAFAGQQRYGANSWSGDVVSSWENLHKQIPAGLNFSLSGIPYWNSDIGGFFAWNYPGGIHNKAFNELYVRWLQFGTFCPMMRSHGTDTPREIYQFGEKGDWEYDAIDKYINLRYSLLPYTYSTAWDVTANASSMMRALVMDFPNDKKALALDNEYLFGKSVLVCPVTEPMYVQFDQKDGKSRNAKEDFNTVKMTNIYLPAGTQWYDFWTGDLLDGGQDIERETPIDLIPLYVKAGSILPMGPKVEYANETIGPLSIRVYPGDDGSFVFYDDERDNYNYEDGAYATIKMKWNDESQTLTIGERKGSYTGMPETRTIKVMKVGKDNGVGLPNEKELGQTIEYTGKTIQVTL